MDISLKSYAGISIAIKNFDFSTFAFCNKQKLKSSPNILINMYRFSDSFSHIKITTTKYRLAKEKKKYKKRNLKEFSF